MNWEMIKNNWDRLKVELKDEWDALTDDHLDRIAGDREELSAKIQQFYGISPAAADAQVDAFAERHQPREADG